jgi:hypothetical protein
MEEHLCRLVNDSESENSVSESDMLDDCAIPQLSTSTADVIHSVSNVSQDVMQSMNSINVTAVIQFPNELAFDSWWTVQNTIILVHQTKAA